jgi:hypothetical protein
VSLLHGLVAFRRNEREGCGSARDPDSPPPLRRISSSPAVAEASKRSVLSVLTKGRLEDLAREFAITLQSTATKDAQVTVLADSALDLGSVLGRLRRDELRSACRAHGVDATGRGRNDLMIRSAAPGTLPALARSGLPGSVRTGRTACRARGRLCRSGTGSIWSRR